jgi:hypothetical protein
MPDTAAKSKALIFTYMGAKGAMIIYTVINFVRALPLVTNPLYAPEAYQNLTGFRDLAEIDEHILTPTLSSIKSKFIDKPNEVLSGSVREFLSGRPLVSVKTPNNKNAK